MAKKINYGSRNFAAIRTDLINYVRQYYPEILNDFSDASIGSLFIELMAGVGDNLSYHTDKMFNETQLDFAQERRSILSMARTFGLKIPGKRPSISIVDFSVTVPVLGDSFDLSYAPLIRRGAQVVGAGKVFEALEDIDFSSPFTTGGFPNRLVIPNFDANNNIINYTLTKREIVSNGQTKIYKRVITSDDVKPFFELVLPDQDVLSIESIIMLEGTNYTSTPNVDDFLNKDVRWYEVDALAQETVFVEDTVSFSDNPGISPGRYIKTDRRFITEYTDNGFIRVIFGGGSEDTGSLKDFSVNPSLIDRIGDIINNLSLGITPSANHTMFIQYRVGGGSDSNIGVNVINSTGLVNITVNGSNPNINQQVIRSLKVNNPTPALGGRDEPSVEEIRNQVRYNFASQGRAVTLKDYKTSVFKMPGKFGVPYRCGVYEYQNKVIISTLGLDSDGKLSNNSTNTLNQNIANYLSDIRMINDYVEIKNGRIINLGFEVDLFVDKSFPQSQIISSVISEITDYIDISQFDMGQDIYLAQLVETINNVGGVLNVIDLRIYNKVGDNVYSLNEISQPYLDEETRQIDIRDNYMLFGEPTGMYEVKFPSKDIKVRVKGG
jgi:hypothetical protein